MRVILKKGSKTPVVHPPHAAAAASASGAAAHPNPADAAASVASSSGSGAAWEVPRSLIPQAVGLGGFRLSSPRQLGSLGSRKPLNYQQFRLCWHCPSTFSACLNVLVDDLKNSFPKD